MKKLVVILLVTLLPAKVGSQHTSYFDSLNKQTPDFLKVGVIQMPDLVRFDGIHFRMERRYQRYKTGQEFSDWIQANGLEDLADWVDSNQLEESTAQTE